MGDKKVVKSKISDNDLLDVRDLLDKNKEDP